MRLNTKALLSGIGCVAAAAMTQPTMAGLLTNPGLELAGGGFHAYGVGSELGTHRYGPPSYGSTAPDGWTRVGTRGWTTSDLAGDAFPAANGDYAYRLDSNPAGNPGGNPDALTQGGINLVAGQQYTLVLDVWAENANGSLLDVDLSGAANVSLIDDLVVDGTDGQIDNVSVNFTVATTGTYTIELSSPDNGDNHTWVDNVDIVPEPGSLALMGLGGLLIARRRRG